MASPSNLNPPTYGSDTSTPNTTFVQADPSNFRTIVQQLTGAPDDPSTQKLPLTHHHHHHQTRPNSTTAAKRPTFKLHERRQTTNNYKNLHLNSLSLNTPTSLYNNNNYCSFLVSPVSTLEHFLSARVINSPKSPNEEAEERAIAEKGFYLHPILSPLGGGTPRGADPPELLPLFPLRSPRDEDNRNVHRDEDGYISNGFN